jgi:hypothetical protein
MSSRNYLRRRLVVETLRPVGDGSPNVYLDLRWGKRERETFSLDPADLHGATGRPLKVGDRVWVNSGATLPHSIFFDGRTIWRNPAKFSY